MTTDLTIVEYQPTAAALDELRRRYANVAFDVATTVGNKAAREARRELVGLRTSLEAKRKELKAPALDYSRRIDAEAKRLTEAIAELEGPIDAQIKADEARRERERAEREAAERARVDAIVARIESIKAAVTRAVGRSSVVIQTEIDTLSTLEIDDSFEEFKGRAEQAKAESLTALHDLHVRTVAQEEEARRLRAEREELDRQQREEAARRAEQERIDREAREAEERRIAERRAQEEAALRAERDAEEARLAAERAEIARQHAELEKLRREQEERGAAAIRAEREKREAAEREAAAHAAKEAAERRRQELVAQRERDERMARLSEAAETMFDALLLVRGDASWRDLTPGTREAVDAAIAAASENQTAEAA